MSKNMVVHINESLKIKAIPTPKILIKDHKKLTSMGDFPTRLMIPEISFSATFAKVGYLGLKKMLEKNDTNYTELTIFQAIAGKGRMGEFELENKWGKNCINRCSSNVPFDKISSSEERNFISHKKLTKDPEIHCKLCLKLIAFGMSSTLLTFEEIFFE